MTWKTGIVRQLTESVTSETKTKLVASTLEPLRELRPLTLFWSSLMAAALFPWRPRQPVNRYCLCYELEIE